MGFWKNLTIRFGLFSSSDSPTGPTLTVEFPGQPREGPDLEPFRVTLMARASSGGAYPVTFTCRDNRVWLKCGCTAGKFSQFCKHKFHLLDGNADWLADPAHAPELAKLLEVISSTGFPELLQRYKQALCQGSEAAAKDAKKQLRMAMRRGV